MEDEAGGGRWQRHAQLASALEAVFVWLSGAELARAGAACRAWRAAARGSAAWRRLLRDRAPGAEPALRALAELYQGACPWRALFAAAAAPWEATARLEPAPAPAAPLAAAALTRTGDALALAAGDCSFTIWKCSEEGCWRQTGAGSAAAQGWRGVARVEWAPDGARLLMVALPEMRAARVALAVLRPGPDGWCVSARASGAHGCWAGADAFLALEMVRLSAPQHAPVFGTDVWLYAASQGADSEHAGVASRVLRVFNGAYDNIKQVACAATPLDARAAREWAAAEAAVRAEDALGRAPADPRNRPFDEIIPGEDYYRATHEGHENDIGDECAEGAWVRLVVVARGAVLSAWPLPRAAPPPLHVRVGLADRVAARRAAREQQAALVAAARAAPEPSVAELRARCVAPTARLRLPARVLGLAVHPSGRCVWAAAAGGAVCASLPALAPLRAVAAPAPSQLRYVQPHCWGPYFASPYGDAARVWGAAPDAGALLSAAGAAGVRAALSAAGARAALLMPGSRAALLLTDRALHVWERRAPPPPPPPPPPPSAEPDDEEVLCKDFIGKYDYYY